MNKLCQHCQKLQLLYPEREYQPMTHIKKNCPILAETKCYNCGEVGHTPKYCGMPKVKCLNCGKMGHTTELCNIIEVQSEYIIKPNSWILLNLQKMHFENNE